MMFINLNYIKKNYKKLLYPNLNNSLLTLLLVLLIGCSNKNEKIGEAKVGNKVLTLSNLEKQLDTLKIDRSFKNEYVKLWVEREILYQKALEDSILYSTQYKQLIEKAKKEIAGALYLQKFFKENDLTYSEKELVEFYNQTKKQYEILNDAYIYNFAILKNYNAARAFRKKLFNNNWERVIKIFAEDLIFHRSNQFKFTYQIDSKSILKALASLKKTEVSITLNNKEPNQFCIVQAVDKLRKSDIPSFKYVRDEVAEKYATHKRKKLYNSLIKKLYLEYDVKIKKDNK